MGPFKFSISAKLILLAVSTSLLTLVCTTVALVLIDQERFQTSLVSIYSTVADTIGHNCSQALLKQQPVSANAILSALEKDPDVEVAGVLNGQGEWLAVYQRKTEPLLDLKQIRARAGQTGLENSLHILRPVALPAGQRGEVYLQVRQSRLETLRKERWVVISFILFSSVVISTLLAWGLQAWISRPVQEMLRAVRRVTESGDYSVRVQAHSLDELGELSDGFNTMLAQIACRDAELDEHRRHLKHLVLQRTIELETKTREAQNASKAKAQFLANMSHEIRTPMNAILGFAEQLQRGQHKLGADEREFVDTIHSSGQHLLRLINDILELSKVESGRLEVDRTECSPHQIITQVVANLHEAAVDKGLAVAYDWVGPVPARIHTDAEKFGQVLICIIENAIKFTEQGGVQIVAMLDQVAGQMEVDVIDSGIGIPADQLGQIFRPFTQADYSMTRKYSGSGLGLTISRRIAESLGGTLEVESQVGVGSRFKLTLDVGSLDGVPLLAAPPAVDITPEIKAKSDDPFPILPPLRVLLVEDGETNRRLIHLMLRRHGCEVVNAENGQVGVRLAVRQEFDVILMDMQMPVKDGYSATSELRTLGLTTPIIALTAHAMSGDEERCLRAGCTGYLTKPSSELHLIQKLAELTQPKTTAGSTTMTPHNDAPRPPALPCDLPLDDLEFRSIIEEFAVRLDERLTDARASATNSDVRSLAAFAHWLKGSGGTVGFHQFTSPAATLEQLATVGDIDQAQLVLEELDLLRERIVSTLVLANAPPA